MRFSRVELLFLAAGAGLGGLVALAAHTGWLAGSAAFPRYLFVLIGLGLIEVVFGFVTGRPPGALVGMPARILAFVLGLGVLALVTGGIA